MNNSIDPNKTFAKRKLVYTLNLKNSSAINILNAESPILLIVQMQLFVILYLIYNSFLYIEQGLSSTLSSVLFGTQWSGQWKSGKLKIVKYGNNLYKLNDDDNVIWLCIMLFLVFPLFYWLYIIYRLTILEKNEN